MTPILRPAGIPERAYNTAHRSTRNVVERLNGVLKSRWRLLSIESRLRFSPARSATTIVAAAILHNIARRRGDRDFRPGPPQPRPRGNVRLLDHRGGNIVRTALIHRHFQ